MDRAKQRLDKLSPKSPNAVRLFLVAVFVVLEACTAPALGPPQPKDQEIAAESHLQRVVYVKTLLAEQERLARIAYRLSVRVVDLCGDHAVPTTGAFLFDWDQTSDEWVDVANEAIGINLHTPGIEVLIVVPGSPAEKAGLKVGDRITRIDDWHVPSKRGAFAAFRDRLNDDLAARRKEVRFRIQRGAEFLTIRLTPIAACDYPVLVADDNAINAYTDGTKIVVFRGMLRTAADDDELAMVIAHELAHIALGHIDMQRQNALAGASVGAIFDVLIAARTGIQTRLGRNVGAVIGAGAYSKEFETEADYMSAYMLAQAGYDYTRIPEFHRYLSTIDRDETGYRATHPSFPQRVVTLEKIVQEIREKEAGGRPLKPELR